MIENIKIIKTNKICNSCNQDKEINEFHKSHYYGPTNTQYFQPFCKECENRIRRDKWNNNEIFREREKTRGRIWREENKEEITKRYQKWSSNKVVTTLSRLRGSSKRRKLEFNLTEEDIIIPEYCPILNVKLSYDKDKQDYWPSVDRIDNSKGYIKGNIQIISNRANRIKTDSTIEELEILLRFLKNG